MINSQQQTPLNNGQYSTIATPLIIDLKMSILTRWDTAIISIGNYKKLKSMGAGADKRAVITSVYSLFLTVRSSLRESKKEEEYKKISDVFEKECPEEYIKAFDEIDKFLYDKNIVKFDTKGNYDRTIVENANQNKGL